MRGLPSDSEEWFESLASEVEFVLKNNTFELVERPKDRDIVESRFILRYKYGTNGSLQRRKARVVVKGYSQQPGRDFHETYVPVARLETIRLAVAYAAKYRMHIRLLRRT